MNTLLTLIKNSITLNENETNLIESMFSFERVSRNFCFLNQNQKVNNIYFLIKGIVKGYEIENGNEIVQHLVEENNFFTDFENFKTQTKTLQTFQTITDCEVYVLSKSNFDFILKEFPAFQILINTIMEEAINCKMERLSDFRKLTAKQRYLKLMDSNPKLVQEVSVNDLSSFLGIAPSSLSRIRRQIF